MSDNDSDKTKIKTPASVPQPVPQSEDATRIAPANKTVPSAPQEDKTRIATSRPTQQTPNSPVDDDKTRVSPASSNSSAPTGDVTQFNPTVNPPEDKTRLNPQSQSQTQSPDTSGLQITRANLDDQVTEHGILKKRFVLEKVLGAGGMGIVYKAKDLLKVEAQDRDPYVAIKVLSEEFKAHPEAFISLQRESRKSQRIAHPNIVNVFDFDRDDDTVFMTMEFLDGSPLDELIRQYKTTGLPTDDAIKIINDMSSALEYAHAQNIVHSDFKPGNIFVTNAGIGKVFDFGIARAVSQVEHLDGDTEDKTVFDAGNLGALTPAYASLEMLEGEVPDVRDDIYALGCVAYECFTGVHPYNKMPADEAERQGLKPKRITNIKKHQWRAIERAIAFRREDRIESVEKFIEGMSPKLVNAYRIATIFALLLSVGITSYFLFFKEPLIDPYSEFDIRNELELQIKTDFYKETLEQLLKVPLFTKAWEDSTLKNVKDLVILTKGGDDWLAQKKLFIYKLYMEQITAAIKAYKLTNAKALVEMARNYTEDPDELDQQLKNIAAAVQRNKLRRAAQVEQQKNQQVVQKKVQQDKKLDQVKKKKAVSQFDVALENVNNQLKCQGRLNMRNIETAVIKLRGLNKSRYNSIEKDIVKSLASCIAQVGKAFPERAREAKKHSLRIFRSNRVLSAIVIKSRDPCDSSIAGLGARGKRAVCKDKIKSGGTGPVLVVIPGNSKMKSFAIGKYEVSINELNKFCKSSSACKTITGRDGEFPAAQVSFKVAKSYMKWLSKQTSQKYRLPTKNEWVYAAKSRRKKLDANRNCKLSTRGIEKGEGLVRTSVGKQNSWGLVNYVGNVQEWAYDKGRKLVAVGGSFAQSMDNCDITTSNAQSGKPDKITGLRVVREIRSNT